MKITIPDKVSQTSSNIFKEADFDVHHKPGIDIDETSELVEESDALVVRSFKLHDLVFSKTLKAIGRAGAGTNNIPIDKCTANGIVVFNTPGANANAVKELVLCGLLLSSRKIVDGVNWVSKNNHTDELHVSVEKNKSQFKGNEILGKTLGVVGLGSIGTFVAKDAHSLGMKIVGHDPFASEKVVEKINRKGKTVDHLHHAVAESDYLTIHVPFSKSTTGMINKDVFNKMKKGMKILNFSRHEIVNTNDLIEALDNGTVHTYVTDFPHKDLMSKDNVICIPHLGASTKEAEENCAVMVTNQVIDFLNNGNIVNSVNFPSCSLERSTGTRITVAAMSVTGTIKKITKILNNDDLSIANMINKVRDDVTYTILDVDGNVSGETINKINSLEEVFRVRKLNSKVNGKLTVKTKEKIVT